MLTTRRMIPTSAFLAAALLAAGATLAAAEEKKAKSDKEQLQGTWAAVSGERSGEKMSEAQLKNWEKMAFADDKFTREGSEKKEGTYALDPMKEPKEIDLNLTVKGRAATWQGIYELKGTKLKLALKPGGRPTDFDSKAAVILIVFEKQK
jgi:uncharacterized protein (TIGR03067 family)